MASTRPRFEGDTRTDIDIWVAQRKSKRRPVGRAAEPGRAGQLDLGRLLSDTDPRRGLFFVSRRTLPGVTCGMGDIYFTRENPARGWETPEHLGCQSDGGPNTPLDEQGPSYVKTGGPTLYFSSGPDIYRSERHGNGRFGPAEAVAELNSAAMDIQPNVRRDGREIVFASNRGGTTAFGGQDIWVATRKGVNGPWSTPSPRVSRQHDRDETRPSLSWQPPRSTRTRPRLPSRRTFGSPPGSRPATKRPVPAGRAPGGESEWLYPPLGCPTWPGCASASYGGQGFALKQFGSWVMLGPSQSSTSSVSSSGGSGSPPRRSPCPGRRASCRPPCPRRSRRGRPRPRCGRRPPHAQLVISGAAKDGVPEKTSGDELVAPSTSGSPVQARL